MANIYVIDTSALISNPDVVKKSRRHGVLIPTVVLRQLDGLKNSSDGNVAYWARKASQAIEKQQRKGNLLIESTSATVNSLDNAADNNIIGTALHVKRNIKCYTDGKVKNVFLISTDRNMRIAAANYGMKTKTVKHGKGTFDKVLSVAMYCTCFIAASLWSMFNLFIREKDSLLKGPLGKYSAELGIICIVSMIITGILMAIYRLRRGGSFNYDNSDNSRNDVIYNPVYSDTSGNIYHR